MERPEGTDAKTSGIDGETRGTRSDRRRVASGGGRLHGIDGERTEREG